MNTNILGIGNALTDLLCVLPSDELIDRLNVQRGSMQIIDAGKLNEVLEMISGYDVKMVRGGSAPNTLGGVAKLGCQAGFIGKIGCDNVGQFFENDIRDRGIRSLMIKDPVAPSGTCVALISPDGERTFLTCLGAALGLGAQDLTEDMFAGYGICHVDGYLVQNYDLIESAIFMAKKAGAKVSLDLASFNVVKENHDFVHRLVHDYVDIVFANEAESLAFTGKEPEQALECIADMAEYAVVKVGAKGSMAKHGSQTLSFSPMQNVNCVDTTGAGDLYAAGFLWGVANEKDLATCGHVGTLVSGHVVQVVGTKMTDEMWQDIKNNI